MLSPPPSLAPLQYRVVGTILFRAAVSTEGGPNDPQSSENNSTIINEMQVIPSYYDAANVLTS